MFLLLLGCEAAAGPKDSDKAEDASGWLEVDCYEADNQWYLDREFNVPEPLQIWLTRGTDDNPHMSYLLLPSGDIEVTLFDGRVSIDDRSSSTTGCIAWVWQ